ncbi:MAG TPA: 50S ribosomal protein L10 [Candidatus Eisenbacteria bacterium]|nr:50S ribosomal protein L10 [Candidatus Eisenbacteria bacterium]
MKNDNTKMSGNKEKKVAIVAEVKEKVDKAKAMVFTDYTGLTHQQLETLKKEIRKADAEYAVTKNTLLKLALGEKVADQEDKFQNPTGTMFLYGDVVTPLKTLAKMIKEMEKPAIKFGLFDGKVMTDKDVLTLSTLPSREVLLAQLAGMLKSPIQGLHRALSWNMQKLVLTLAAVQKTKTA